MSKRNDPYGRFNFLLEIDGVATAGFTEVSGLSTETSVIEYREGSDRSPTRKLPGITKYSNITLKRGITKRPLSVAMAQNGNGWRDTAKERVRRPAR